MDKQQIGLVGKQLLLANLLRAGIEVAEPLRDRGIDLIAYNDRSKDGKFIARPIQIKTAMRESFGLSGKYKKFNELRIVFIWHAEEPSISQFFVLGYDEALHVLKSRKSGKKNYARTSFWKNRGNYTTTSPSEVLKDLFGQYKVDSSKDWVERLGMKEAFEHRVKRGRS